jgi:hypothetical protein
MAKIQFSQLQGRMLAYIELTEKIKNLGFPFLYSLIDPDEKSRIYAFIQIKMGKNICAFSPEPGLPEFFC